MNLAWFYLSCDNHWDRYSGNGTTGSSLKHYKTHGESMVCMGALGYPKQQAGLCVSLLWVSLCGFLGKYGEDTVAVLYSRVF